VDIAVLRSYAASKVKSALSIASRIMRYTLNRYVETT
jgi:hypothetical protein